MNIKGFIRFIKKILIIDTISITIILLFWFIKGPQNLVFLVDCFSFGGILLMIPGAFIYIGPRSIPGLSINKQQISVKKIESEEQLEEDKKKNLFFRRIGMQLLLAGILLILISLFTYAIG